MGKSVESLFLEHLIIASLGIKYAKIILQGKILRIHIYYLASAVLLTIISSKIYIYIMSSLNSATFFSMISTSLDAETCG